MCSPLRVRSTLGFAAGLSHSPERPSLTYYANQDHFAPSLAPARFSLAYYANQDDFAPSRAGASPWSGPLERALVPRPSRLIASVSLGDFAPFPASFGAVFCWNESWGNLDGQCAFNPGSDLPCPGMPVGIAQKSQSICAVFAQRVHKTHITPQRCGLVSRTRAPISYCATVRGACASNLCTKPIS